MTINSSNIAYKLIFVFIILTLCFGIFSLIQLSNMNKKVQALNSNYFPKSQLSTNLRIDLPRLQRIELRFILSSDSKEKQDLYSQSKSVVTDIIILLNKYQFHPTLTPTEAQHLNSFQENWEKYIELQPLIMNPQQIHTNSELQNTFFIRRLTFYHEMARDVSALMEYNNEAMLQISKQTAQTYKRSKQLILSAMLLSLIVGTTVIVLFQKQLNLQENLQRQAERDELTGLYNRRFLFKQGDILLSNGSKASIIMADIDHFKAINDRYGHDGGDNALRTLSLHMLRSFRINDIVVRYGGEEFVILLPDTQLFEAKLIAERLRVEAAKLRCQSEDQETFGFTLSLGVVEQHNIYTSLSCLLSEVDKYLYLAKKNGRNQVAAPN